MVQLVNSEHCQYTRAHFEFKLILTRPSLEMTLCAMASVSESDTQEMPTAVHEVATHQCECVDYYIVWLRSAGM